MSWYRNADKRTDAPLEALAERAQLTGIAPAAPVEHSSLRGLRNSMFGLNPLNQGGEQSALGRRDANPLGEYNRSRGGLNPHSAPRWEYDEALGEWVESDLPEDEYADIYGAMGTPDKRKSRQQLALQGLQGAL